MILYIKITRSGYILETMDINVFSGNRYVELKQSKTSRHVFAVRFVDYSVEEYISVRKSP